jgi:acetyltransferase-like isoleucine patch superfamily enzyme
MRLRCLLVTGSFTIAVPTEDRPLNTVERTWLTLKHRWKFAKTGKRCQFPIPKLCVQGHVELGDLCRFRNDVTLRTHGDGKIIFGNRSGLSWGCTAEAHQLIEIGNYTAVAEYSLLCDTMPILKGNTGGRSEVEYHSEPIKIGNDVFVGSGCFIGPGVTIGDGAVIGPFSVITRDVGPLEIWNGVPARKWGHRTDGISETQLQEYRDLVARDGVQGDRYKKDSRKRLWPFGQ